MGQMFLRHDYTSPKRCDKCRKPVKSLYNVQLDEGLMISVCSGLCAERARVNFQEKKDKGIKPGVPAIKGQTIDTDIEDDGIIL